MLGNIGNSGVVQRCKYTICLLFTSLFLCLFVCTCTSTDLSKGGGEGSLLIGVWNSSCRVCVGEICVYSQFQIEISNFTTLLIFCKTFHHFERFWIHLEPVLSNKMFHNLFIKSRPLNLGGLLTVRFWLYCKVAFRVPTFEKVLSKIISHQNCCYLYIFGRVTLIYQPNLFFP